jgi:excisionase family DNA binding protein
MSKKQAATALNCSPKTIQRLLRDGKLPKVMVRKSLRIPIDAVLELASKAQ